MIFFSINCKTLFYFLFEPLVQPLQHVSAFKLVQVNKDLQAVSFCLCKIYSATLDL